MTRRKPSTLLSQLFRALSQPARVEILLAIGSGEACVCHLETVLKMRQAYISQHLMALREAGVLTTRREGRFVFYRLIDPAWMEFIQMAAATAGISRESLLIPWQTKAANSCPCPQCNTAKAESLVKLEGVPDGS